MTYIQQPPLLAAQLSWVLMTAEYEILAPDEAMGLASINHSTAKRFVDDPVSTLRGLDHRKFQERANYLMRNWKKNPPKLARRSTNSPQARLVASQLQRWSLAGVWKEPGTN